MFSWWASYCTLIFKILITIAPDDILIIIIIIIITIIFIMFMLFIFSFYFFQRRHVHVNCLLDDSYDIQNFIFFKKKKKIEYRLQQFCLAL